MKLDEVAAKNENRKALENFVFDEDCLLPLAKWTSENNLFEIIGISRLEIKHSNVLAWLMRPNEQHGLGDSVLRAFFRYVAKEQLSDHGDELFQVLMADYRDYSVYREREHMDILAVPPANGKQHSNSGKNRKRYLLCIENKIGASEGENQLRRYREKLEKDYPEYQMLLVFLTPDRAEPSDPAWCVMGYDDVLRIIDHAVENAEKTLDPDVKMLIEHYQKNIRRHVMQDDELVEICQEIYSKHQRALDLIFDNRPDETSPYVDEIRKWTKGKADYEELIWEDDRQGEKVFNKSKTTLFWTKNMDELLRNKEDQNGGKKRLSRWNTDRFYFYAISVEKKENAGGDIEFGLCIQLTLNATSDMPAELKKMEDKVIAAAGKKGGINVWKQVFKKVGKADDIDAVKTTLDGLWKHAREFESRILKSAKRISA